MRIVALDIGDRRTGVAVSDDRMRVASPLVVLDTAELLRDGSKLRTLLLDYEAERVVVGLPLTLNGEEGPQARHVRALVSKLFSVAGKASIDEALASGELIFFDERFSSKEAERSLMAQGLTEREQRGKVDMIAAALFLQTYLDSLQETT